MTDAVPILKDEDRQWPVPSVWRLTLKKIVNAFKNENYVLSGIIGVEQLNQDAPNAIRESIRSYGETLGDLSDESWNTSVCQWQIKYWDLIVDLFSIGGERTDLVLHVKVFEQGRDFRFKVHFVYVP